MKLSILAVCLLTATLSTMTMAGHGEYGCDAIATYVKAMYMSKEGGIDMDTAYLSITKDVPCTDRERLRLYDLGQKVYSMQPGVGPDTVYKNYKTNCK